VCFDTGKTYVSSKHYLKEAESHTENSGEQEKMIGLMGLAGGSIVTELEVVEEAHALVSVSELMVDDGSSFGGKWDIEAGNERGVDHSKVAVDGKELFERFAAFGVGRHYAEEGQGGLRRIEMDSSAFIKFFRDCALLHQKPDFLKEASVDIWWTSMNHKLKQEDPEGIAHVDYPAFHEHVIVPLSKRKKIGEQLLVAMCLSRLPTVDTSANGENFTASTNKLASGHSASSMNHSAAF